MNTRFALGVAALLAAASVAAGPLLAQPEAARSGAGGAGSGDWDTIIARFGGCKAETRPARDATMKFSFPTEIREVSVEGGQRVRKGDVLVRARDAELIAAIEQQESLAKSDLEVRGAAKAQELAAIKLENLKNSKGSFSSEEFDSRRIEAETAAIQHEQARFNLEQQTMRLKQLRGQYERYRLEAPFDGVIEDVLVEVGQGVSEQDPAIRVVDIDKLELEPTPSISETLRLKLGPRSRVWVLVDLPGKPALVEGRIQYVSPVGESVGLTRRVKVEIDNAEGWPAGTQALVRFEPPSDEWTRYLVEPNSASGGTKTAEGARR